MCRNTKYTPSLGDLVLSKHQWQRTSLFCILQPGFGHVRYATDSTDYQAAYAPKFTIPGLSPEPRRKPCQAWCWSTALPWSAARLAPLPVCTHQQAPRRPNPTEPR